MKAVAFKAARTINKVAKFSRHAAIDGLLAAYVTKLWQTMKLIDMPLKRCFVWNARQFSQSPSNADNVMQEWQIIIAAYVIYGRTNPIAPFIIVMIVEYVELVTDLVWIISTAPRVIFVCQ